MLIIALKVQGIFVQQGMQNRIFGSHYAKGVAEIRWDCKKHRLLALKNTKYPYSAVYIGTPDSREMGYANFHPKAFSKS